MDIKNKLALFFNDRVNSGIVTQSSSRPFGTAIEGRECSNKYGNFF